MLADTLTPQHVVWFGAAGAALILPLFLRFLLSGAGRLERDRVRRLHALQPARVQDSVQSLLQTRPRKSWLQSLPLAGDLPRRMRQAGMTMPAERFLGLCALSGAVVLLAALQLMAPLAAVALAVTTSALLPLMLVNAARNRRIAAFTLQLPDALELMTRGLRVGHPLGATIANVGHAMADPLGAEFRQMADQISYGDELTKAFRDLADRIDQEDMHYLAVSVAIQHSTGGNLARMLQVLAKVIRDRIMMRRRVRAISSEGRISAWVLSSLPIIIYTATSITAPNYYSGVSDDPKFMPIVVIIVALVVGNFLALRRLTAFRF